MQVSKMSQEKRDALKSLVRSHNDWLRWRTDNNVKADGVTNAVIAKAIVDLGLVESARQIIGEALDHNGAVQPIEAGEETTVSENEAGAMIVGDSRPAVEASTTIEADMSDVLSPIAGFLAPGLLKAVEDKLRPVVEAARKPAQIVTQTVTVEAEKPLAPGEAPRAKRVSQSTMRAMFGVRGAQGKLSVQLWNDPTASKPDPDYVLEPARMFEMASSLERGKPVWLAGEAGTGKSTMAQEYAALTGRGYVRIGFTKSTDNIDLIGQEKPAPGEFGSVQMLWKDNVFVQAIRRPGTVILLDELTHSPPGTSALFQTILDHRYVTLLTGEVVRFADGVVVLIADNTAGYGDESGSYAGTQSANAALVDRACRTIIVDYLPADLEAKALHKRTKAPLPACERVANFARAARKANRDAGGESRPFSIRRLEAFIEATYCDLIDATRAWQITALSRLPEADRATLETALAAHFDAKAYERELRGLSIEAGESVPYDQVTLDAAASFGAIDS